MRIVDVTKVFDWAADAVCKCVFSADWLIESADPRSVETDSSDEWMIESADPALAETAEYRALSQEGRSLFRVAAMGFEALAYSLMMGVFRFDSVKHQIRALYTQPPELFGDLPGASFHDKGLAFAGSTFTRLQIVAGLQSIWSVPIRGATEEQVHRRAVEIGQRAEVILLQFWESARRCDAQRLDDCIKIEASRAVEAWHSKMRGQ